MNNRIKELADQCRITIGIPGSDSWSETVVFDEQKFAKLIIKECGYYADVFDSLGCPIDMNSTETKPSDYINRMMEVE